MAGMKRAVGGDLAMFNLCMYIVMCGIAGWSLNNAINHHLIGKAAVALPIPFWSLYFPTGNAATGFFVIFSLIAGVVGASSCLSGLAFFKSMSSAALHSAASSAMSAWSLTLLAMGLACKEIHLHGSNSPLITLEVFSIIVSGTQLLYFFVLVGLKVA